VLWTRDLGGNILLEKLGYAILLIAAVAWLVIVAVGLISAFPAGMTGLLVIVGLGLLFVKVLRDRLKNKEDEYYSENVKQ
jgi:hypothetical protein